MKRLFMSLKEYEEDILAAEQKERLATIDLIYKCFREATVKADKKEALCIVVENVDESDRVEMLVEILGLKKEFEQMRNPSLAKKARWPK